MVGVVVVVVVEFVAVVAVMWKERAGGKYNFLRAPRELRIFRRFVWEERKGYLEGTRRTTRYQQFSNRPGSRRSQQVLSLYLL